MQPPEKKPEEEKINLKAVQLKKGRSKSPEPPRPPPEPEPEPLSQASEYSDEDQSESISELPSITKKPAKSRRQSEVHIDSLLYNDDKLCS